MSFICFDLFEVSIDKTIDVMFKGKGVRKLQRQKGRRKWEEERKKEGVVNVVRK